MTPRPASVLFATNRSAYMQWCGRLTTMQERVKQAACPLDNAFAESFIKTVKAEEVYLFEYKTRQEAYERIPKFIDDVYNQKRLHSALGYLPPNEFEEQLEKSMALA